MTLQQTKEKNSMYDTIIAIAFSAFFLAGAVLTVGFLTVLIVDEELRAKGGMK